MRERNKEMDEMSDEGRKAESRKDWRKERIKGERKNDGRKKKQ